MSAATKWGDRVKTDLSNTSTKALKPISGVGNLPPIDVYFQYRALKEGAPPAAKQLIPSTTILGTYEGSFTTKKFGTTYHKVQTDNGLVAIPGATQLNAAMQRVAQGAEVQIVYNGMNVMEKGNYAGKSAHSFSVAASESID